MASPPSQKKIHPWTVPGLLIVVVLGLVVGYNLFVTSMLRSRVEGGTTDRLAYRSKLSKNLVVTEKSGKTVELKELRGKVLVASFLFSRCPSGCAGIQAEIGNIAREFSGNEDGLQFLSFSLDPEHDTPEVLQQFASLHQLDAPNWWFLTGDPEALHSYMVNQFKFQAPVLKKEEERLYPGDLYNHDMRVALVDHLGNVRGYYPILVAEIHKENLRADLKRLLKESGTPSPGSHLKWFWVVGLGMTLGAVLIFGFRESMRRRALREDS